MRGPAFVLMLATLTATGTPSAVARTPSPDPVDAELPSAISQDDAVALVLASDARFRGLPAWPDLWESSRDDLGQDFIENSYFRVHSAFMADRTPMEFLSVAPRVPSSWLVEVTLVRDCSDRQVPADAPESTDDIGPFIDDPCDWRHSWFYRVRPDGEVTLLHDEGDPDLTDPGSAADVERRLPDVVVLDAGAAPRKLLRYDLAEGQTERFTLELDIDVKTTMQGASTPWLDFPTFIASGTATVVAVNEDGTYEIESVVSDHLVDDDGDPAMAERFRAQLPSLVGTVTRSRMDDRGRLLESETTMPAGYVAPEGVPQPGQFDAMAVNQAQPLPEEPVGDGAIWEVTATDATIGFETSTVTAMTLDALAPDGSFMTSGTLVGTAEPQPMPGAPDFVEATIDEFGMQGSYRWDIDPTRIVITSVGTAHSTVAYAVTAPDETRSIEMETRVGIRLLPSSVSLGSGRVEVADGRIAMTFPAGWSVEKPTPTVHPWLYLDDEPVDAQRQAPLLWATTEEGGGSRCWLADITRLAEQAPSWTTLEEAVEFEVEFREKHDEWSDVQSAYLELASGRVGRVDAKRDVRHALSIHFFVDGDTWYSLDCRSVAPPEDRWRSVAETLEFLPGSDG